MSTKEVEVKYERLPEYNLPAATASAASSADDQLVTIAVFKQMSADAVRVMSLQLKEQQASNIVSAFGLGAVVGALGVLLYWKSCS